MECPNCDKDFKEDENLKPFYTKQINHFGKPFRQFGYVCPHCSFHVTMMQIPVRVPFIRTERTYDKLDEIVREFKQKVVEFYSTKQAYSEQLRMFEKNEED